MKTVKVSSSKERIKEMMQELNLRQSEICAKTGITKSALSNYINGTREPRQDALMMLSVPYGINPTWLMGLDVPMYTKDSVAFNDVTLLGKFKKLTPANQQVIMSTIDALLLAQGHD